MSLKRRTFTREFRLAVIQEVEAGKPQAEIARHYQINQNTICKWVTRYHQNKEKAFGTEILNRKDVARINEMERVIGRLALENELLKKALQRLEARRR